MVRGIGLVAAVLVLWPPVAPAQQGNAEPLLQRVGDAVQVFVDNFSNVVAEEDYRQQFRQAAPSRRLRSDFLLVGYPGQEKVFLTFRDVLEVNGRPVRDQQERLSELFLAPFQDAVRRAGEIQRAGIRHSVERGRLMDPLQALAHLQHAYQGNFSFTVGGLEPSLGSEVRKIEFEQKVEPGAVQAAVRGTAWVAGSTGRVLKTELRVGRAPNVRFTTTTFGVDPVLRIDVPLEMLDVVPLPRDDEFQGRATYRNFRRFQVRAEEQIAVPPTPR